MVEALKYSDKIMKTHSTDQASISCIYSFIKIDTFNSYMKFNMTCVKEDL